MNYLEHMLLSITAVFILFSVLQTPFSPQAASIALIGGILPDVDHAKSKAFKLFLALFFGLVFSLVFYFLKEGALTKTAYSALAALLACAIVFALKPRHRGITHSLLAASVFALAIYSYAGLLLGLSAFLAYASHLASDGVVKLA